MFDTLTLRPIGVIHTPFVDKVSAPRQTYVARDAEGTIVLEPGRDFEDALDDLASWEYLWVLYWFHLNEGWRPKVLPPRSKVRRGLFATRSPHRPSPIGMSVVKLVRVEGLTVHVLGVDMIDGTPVLDLKPYVASADSVPAAGAGWLASPDAVAAFDVVWSESARDEAAWLKDVHGIDLVTPVERALALGPEPHAYRRIRKHSDGGLRLAVKDWRVRFVAEEGRRVRVLGIETGYRAKELAAGETEAARLHQAFCARWRNAPTGGR
jgi:tRNA-Thr(GGU) m(6)t(6)A37 methyltransferase TsaA